MPRNFDYQGPSVAIGSLPDADPNVTPPAAARVFNSTRRNRPTEATVVQYGLIMDTAGTADVTPWIKDETSGEWFAAATEVGVANNELFEVVGIAGADIFFRLTNAATFATVSVVAEVAG